MSRSLWPLAVPEPFRTAAGGFLAERSDVDIAEALRLALGLSQLVTISRQELLDAIAAAEEDPSLFDQLALETALVVARQLRHQYPPSSLVWDDARDSLSELLGAYGFSDAAGPWQLQAEAGRSVVVELTPSFDSSPDDRRFALRWGIVVDRVRFCRHGVDDPHRVACSAVVGGMGSIAPPYGDHLFTVACGMLLERYGSGTLRVLGREGFRSRVHRLANFSSQLTETDRLLEVVSNRPWRLGIGVASRLRDATIGELQDLLS